MMAFSGHRMPLLTIAIPTYNRIEYLTKLLEFLRCELEGLYSVVNVIVVDNASTDGTADFLVNLANEWPELGLVVQKFNLGMDGNFRVCAESVTGDFFWVMGDDDLPMAGSIRLLLDLLKSECPDLVFLKSRWLSDVYSDKSNQFSLRSLKYMRMKRDVFGRRVNVWITYLTGMIIRRTVFLQNSEQISGLAGTSLTQLSWVLERLRDGENFVYVDTCCILATAGNTGGYPVISVFGNHFPRIVREYLFRTYDEKILAKQIINRAMINFMPGLLWNLRKNTAGQFELEKTSKVFSMQLAGHPIVACILNPMAVCPYPIARLLKYLAALFSWFFVLKDRISGDERSKISFINKQFLD